MATTDKIEKLKKLEDAAKRRLDDIASKRKALQHKIESRMNAKKRKDDTRRKIILGGFMLKKMRDDENLQKTLIKELKESLTADRDIKLFE